MMKPFTEREKFVRKLRANGRTFKEIGVQLGISAGRANQIFRRTEWVVNREPHWMDGLGVRASNCLNNFNINSRQQAMEAFKSGKLKAGAGGPRNYGWATHKEVAKWLGLPEPQKPAPKIFIPKTCPHCGGKL